MQGNVVVQILASIGILGISLIAFLIFLIILIGLLVRFENQRCKKVQQESMHKLWSEEPLLSIRKTYPMRNKGKDWDLIDGLNQLSIVGLRRDKDCVVIAIENNPHSKLSSHLRFPQKEDIYLIDFLGKVYKLLSHSADLNKSDSKGPYREVPVRSWYLFEICFEQIPGNKFQLVFGSVCAQIDISEHE